MLAVMLPIKSPTLKDKVVWELVFGFSGCFWPFVRVALSEAVIGVGQEYSQKYAAYPWVLRNKIMQTKVAEED